MATIANPYDPDKDKNKDGSGAGAGQEMASGGVASGDSVGGGGGSSNPSTPYQPPNVQQYLNANEGAGEQLSGAIQSNVQNQANKVNQGVSNTQKQVNSQYDPLNQNLGKGQETANAAFKDPQALLDAYNSAQSQQAANAPITPEQQGSVDQYNQFQKFNTGGYNSDIQRLGSTAQQGYNPLQSQVGNLNQQAKSATNEMGRNQLLQQAVAQPSYSQGQQTLDSLFLQGQGNQLKQGLGNIAKTTGQNVTAAQSDAQRKLAALQGLSGQNQDYIKNLFTQGGADGMGLNQIGEDVNKRYAADQALAATLPEVTQRLAGNNLSPEDIQNLRLGDLQGQKYYNLDLSKYLNKEAPTETLAQAATPEEFARYNALNRLAGGQSGLQPNIFGSATEAGGYDPFGFQKDKFQADAGNAQKYYEQTAAQDAAKKLFPQLQWQDSAGMLDHTDYMESLRNSLAPYVNQPAGDKGPQLTSNEFQNIMNNFLKQHPSKSASYYANNGPYADYLKDYNKYSGNVLGSDKEYKGK